MTETTRHIQDALAEALRDKERYREALEFYADKENYTGKSLSMVSLTVWPIDSDKGQRARAALEGK